MADRQLNDKQIKALNSSAMLVGFKWMSRINTWAFRATDGRLGGKWRLGSKPVATLPPVGILTTTGRKSGEPRDSPLLYLREDDRIVVVASQGGRNTHPMWYLNLVANPQVKFQVRGETMQLTAREATDAERDEYWPKLDAMYPDFVDYRSYTERRIPIVFLDPA
ncbi:nitroreductase family deazaflavin-dependent oxidoreductase [Mycobacterium sp. CBMA293]|uniref:nitroreductase family deazaflavin-dependent oxidoreductase n=1 Tax=unclassified Mycolicibacterium TaxID=2636767 RepID=UPI0012DD2C80|nr:MULTISPECIES: nitroreductase family deazaflavin-dependent oxidoreductase [unclassified Mycolicibacterium]MUL46234.1 nitroreductase family deazaflavin-dependent oxidoreductase [Mycolicibacterium sp. CBMA 360]MUL58715.1 nitroreductase family deazaflavin-dependent oxidoreductase [Mycolicibacterium sp. CBMA 335]MUL69109.1 nitroreductase family deazaflavin-dependent oxidoreductase [Mycolicibacterium sp. CBMA 311]MUL94073.1 nitroreductase family deazaflavin-dependent oxidoreductase [Mycolicibacter